MKLVRAFKVWRARRRALREAHERVLADAYRAMDEAGNARMVPIGGAATLEQWRKDPSLLAPWLLDSDLEPGQDWGAIMASLK